MSSYNLRHLRAHADTRNTAANNTARRPIGNAAGSQVRRLTAISFGMMSLREARSQPTAERAASSDEPFANEPIERASSLGSL